MKKYQALATAFTSRQNCSENDNREWFNKWNERIEQIIFSLPHGSGIDGTTSFNFIDSKTDRLIINSKYHVMNENGYYMNWIDFKITITPSLLYGMDIKITGNFGKNQDLKAYLYDVFAYDLNQTYKWEDTNK